MHHTRQNGKPTVAMVIPSSLIGSTRLRQRSFDNYDLLYRAVTGMYELLQWTVKDLVLYMSTFDWRVRGANESEDHYASRHREYLYNLRLADLMLVLVASKYIGRMLTEDESAAACRIWHNILDRAHIEIAITNDVEDSDDLTYNDLADLDLESLDQMLTTNA